MESWDWSEEIVAFASLSFFEDRREKSLCLATSRERDVSFESAVVWCFWRIDEDLRSDLVWSLLILEIWDVRVVSVLEKDFARSCSFLSSALRSVSDFSSSEIRPR